MIYDRVAEELGWDGFKQSRLDALALEAAILSGGDGDYLEVGVRMGGSAVFAGLVKMAAKQAGDIYGIDSMGPSMAAKGVTPEVVVNRAKRYGVHIKLVVAKSDPWPLPGAKPIVALIDGSHNYEPCLADWNNLKERTQRFILFHDYKPNARNSVSGVVEIAKQDAHWKFVDNIGWMAVFERC